MDTIKQLDSISKKLGILIALNLISMDKKATVTENILLLNRFGLTPTEIAEILNTSAGSVSVIISRTKTNKSKK